MPISSCCSGLIFKNVRAQAFATQRHHQGQKSLVRPRALRFKGRLIRVFGSGWGGDSWSVWLRLGAFGEGCGSDGEFQGQSRKCSWA